MVEVYEPKFNVMNKFKKIGNGPVFYGIEIEIEFLNEELKNTFSIHFCECIDNAKFLLKREPSIRCGIEIVSAPMDITLLITELESIVKVCKTHNAITSDRTGIHIHATKNNNDIKLFEFINNPTHREEIITFSGRLSEYARYTTRKRPHNKGRGYALNIYPKETVEFRMFSCVVDYEWICGCLYFCDILVNNIHKISKYSDLIDISKSYPSFFINRLSNVNKTLIGKNYPIVYPVPDNIHLW